MPSQESEDETIARLLRYIEGLISESESFSQNGDFSNNYCNSIGDSELSNVIDLSSKCLLSRPEKPIVFLQRCPSDSSIPYDLDKYNLQKYALHLQNNIEENYGTLSTTFLELSSSNTIAKNVRSKIEISPKGTSSVGPITFVVYPKIKEYSIDKQAAATVRKNIIEIGLKFLLRKAKEEAIASGTVDSLPLFVDQNFFLNKSYSFADCPFFIRQLELGSVQTLNENEVECYEGTYEEIKDFVKTKTEEKFSEFKIVLNSYDFKNGMIDFGGTVDWNSLEISLDHLKFIVWHKLNIENKTINEQKKTITVEYIEDMSIRIEFYTDGIFLNKDKEEPIEFIDFGSSYPSLVAQVDKSELRDERIIYIPVTYVENYKKLFLNLEDAAPKKVAVLGEIYSISNDIEPLKAAVDCVKDIENDFEIEVEENSELLDLIETTLYF